MDEYGIKILRAIVADSIDRPIARRRGRAGERDVKLGSALPSICGLSRRRGAVSGIG